MSQLTVDLKVLYDLLDDLRERVGGFRCLRHCDGRMTWPRQGVYFFFDANEPRFDSGRPRIVRVGTHAVGTGSGTSLWERLRTHRGQVRGATPNGGNHRGSVFRRHVGMPFIRQCGTGSRLAESWDAKNAFPDMGAAELAVERSVSEYIGGLPLLWVGVAGAAGPSSDRALIEACTISLVSRAGPTAERPSPDWLGRLSDKAAIRKSGLWNVDHVDGHYDRSVLSLLRRHIDSMS